MSRTTIGKVDARLRRARNGFTLIELLMVTVLLTMLAGVAYPRLSGTSRGARLEEAARAVERRVRFAGEAAVIRGATARLYCDAAGAHIWLRIQDPRDTLRARYGTFGDSLVDSAYALPDRIRIDAVLRSGAATPGGMLSFSPSGINEPAEIRLVDETGRVATIGCGPSWRETRIRVAPADEGD